MATNRLVETPGTERAPASNRRTAFRLATSFAVSVRAQGAPRGTREWARADGGAARHLATVTEDISAGGLCFRAPAVLERGTALELAFALDESAVSALASVAHVATDQFGAAIGVSFAGVDGATTSRLVRFITARERMRLPTVPIMYSLQCHVECDKTELDGATEECSPSFARLLLSRAVEPGERVALIVNVGRSEMRLAGRVVTCRRADQLWRTEVDLADLPEVVAGPWRDLVVRLRDASR